jgi:hypothetical protein
MAKVHITQPDEQTKNPPKGGFYKPAIFNNFLASAEHAF